VPRYFFLGLPKTAEGVFSAGRRPTRSCTLGKVLGTNVLNTFGQLCRTIFVGRSKTEIFTPRVLLPLGELICHNCAFATREFSDFVTGRAPDHSKRNSHEKITALDPN
jgi:hypothetical protein